MKITKELLTEHGACSEQLRKFIKLFPNGVRVTKALCIKHANDFDFRWAEENLLNEKQHTEYDRAIAPLWAEYNRATAPARAEFNRATASARAEFNRATALAEAEFNRATASARAEFNRATASARAEFNRAIAPLWAEYNRAKAIAFYRASQVR